MNRTYIRRRRIAAGVLIIAAWFGRLASGDEYDPPTNYYNAATGTGATLKANLNSIIDGHTTRSYDDLRVDLQTVDAVPGDPSKIYVVYNLPLPNGMRQPITKPTGGSIPGWDNGVTWNREHSWPQSRGVDSTGAPDGTDMHHVLPSKNSDNGNRGNKNFGGAFGAQARGVVNGNQYYPGDLDAGLIARAQFYMAVRYDGADGGTTNLELVAGDPSDDGTTMGDLNRLIEWHFAAPPDEYERRRHQTIFDDFQHNRNPFIDRPEYAWSIFVDQANDSQITVNGGTTDANGGSVRNIDYGRVFKNSALPTVSTALTLNKAGTDGTYFEVTAAGLATSSITGRYNAFRTNMTDTKSVTVGLATNTATVGQRTGSVTINNLDITTGGGAGRGANDGNDTVNMSLTVLDHATPSFVNAISDSTLEINLGSRTTAGAAASVAFDVFNWGTTPAFTSNMDFDAVLSSGDTSALTTNAAALAGSLVLAGGAGQTFTAMMSTAAAGTFAATYTLRFSDENIAGAQNNKDITLSLTGTIILAGDFNRDDVVDASDYVVWKKLNGTSSAAFAGADADGSGFVDALDLGWWQQNFGMVAGGAGGGGTDFVPEPGAVGLMCVAIGAWLGARRRRR